MPMIYLDNNATTQPEPAVTDAMLEAQRDLWANPSSVHRFGQQVRRRVELARQTLAALLGAAPRQLVFTSGGTESNNLALHGVLDGVSGGGGVLITTPIEHAAIREPAEILRRRGVELVLLSVDGDGCIDLDHLDQMLAAHAGPQRTTLLSVQWANNETGVLQPMADIAARVAAHRDSKRSRLYLHSDATQAVGKIPVDLSQLAEVDLLSLSAHKFHGPKGVGALYIRRGVRLHAQQQGGPQEMQRRGGTENVPGIIGLGVAAELARQFLAEPTRIERLAAMRDRFEQAIIAQLPGTMVNSGTSRRLWNTSNLAFVGLEAEAVLIGLSERGLCASAGAACSSGSLEPSPVLLAMGIPEPAAHGSVRFSLSRHTTDDELEQSTALTVQVVSKLRQTLPLGIETDGHGG
ncbi:MAG: cysteine desulfurase [Phycisphaeraceae bacterium]|nr:cysteine desulfurase [Phycisphaeraceae bacterium]